jgi:hypothetical protein
MAEIIGNQVGEKITLGLFLCVISDRRLKMTGLTDVWGRIVSEKRERCEPVRENVRVGRGPLLWLGRKGCPSLFYLFFCSANFFFCFFLISLITFSFELKISSNQFLKFSDIQNINTTQ